MDDLEKTIADLVKRKNAAAQDSPEQTFYERQLRALRYRYEEAGGLIEQHDPMGWGGYCRPLAATKDPSGTMAELAQHRRCKAEFGS